MTGMKKRRSSSLSSIVAPSARELRAKMCENKNLLKGREIIQRIFVYINNWLLLQQRPNVMGL